MDYRKIFKSRAMRLKLLQLLSFVPDKPMVKLQYRMKTGRRLDLRDPKRFTEKMQWYKLYYKDPVMVQCVDKGDVRAFVEARGLGDILIPCYGVYDSPKEIDWDALPKRFVMKDTLGGGGSAVVIVKDKSREDIGSLIRRAGEWTAAGKPKKGGGREWPYYSGKNHRIIIEEYIDSDPAMGGLIDYKFFCYDGKPVWTYVIADRSLGEGAGIGVFDSNFRKLDVRRADERPLTRQIEKPAEFDRMKEIARILSAGFPEARIDLYDAEGRILFGEITFYDGSGYMTFVPDEFDFTMGADWKLPEKRLH